MSILKMVNEKQTDRKRLYDKFDYLTAASKTNNGKLVGTTNCISRYAAEEMLMVKKIHPFEYRFNSQREKIYAESIRLAAPETKDQRHSPEIRF